MDVIIVSIVLYNPDLNQLVQLIKPFINNKSLLFIFTDHSSQRLDNFDMFDNINYRYTHDSSNPGFGSGHNNAFKSVDINFNFFLVCNPDIQFDYQSLQKMVTFIESRNQIGLLMPMVVYPNGENQKLSKLLPSPFSLIVRRIPILHKIQNKYTLNHYKYNFPLDVPFLSGCFLFFKSDVFRKIGGFDENYFMYFEDIDICRNVRKCGFRTMVFPEVKVVHNHTYKSIFDYNTFINLLNSAIIYFNKWGWFIDNQRVIDNNYTLSLISKNNDV